MVITCLTKDTTSPGELWNGMKALDRDGLKISETIKKIYIRGIADGIMLVVTIVKLNEQDTEKITNQTYFILKYIEEIMKIMDDLYKDPANVNIKLDFMCLIAYSKLQGENVEALIRDGRILGLLP